MKKFYQFCITSSIVLCYLIQQTRAKAQIVPDATLPVNSSVTSQDNTSIITGGTQAGTNLFHSFDRFSIPTGSAAYFNHNLDIQNIISRVTGSSISQIDGLIRANGANLFLLNPNGIIFGSNTSLNIGGSFLASTARAVNFADGTQFSSFATPQTPPLLTVSVPVGLQFGENPAPIVVQGSLQLQPEKTLALIGGNITLESGNLLTARGRIELGAVASADRVSLNPTPNGWSLSYSVLPRGDIQLKQRSLADTSGEGGGSIQVHSRRLTLTDGSQIRANTLGNRSGGSLNVNTSESVEIIGRLADGTPSALQARVEPGATGFGGDVNIVTRRLRVEGGARVAASSLEAAGKAGTITVVAADAVELLGAGSFLQEDRTV